MRVSYLLTSLVLLLLNACASQKDTALREKTKSSLQEITSFKGVQVTGVTSSMDGRLFASFPRWRENVPFSIVEILSDGTHRPYPNEVWNTWTGSPQDDRFTSIQTVFAHKGFLYALDTASPEMKGIIGNARLFRFDLQTNKLDKVWVFDEQVAPKKSYLNDVRIDSEDKKIIITDSGLGGLIVVDMKTNETKRLLDKHPSTKAEKISLVINEEKFNRRIHSDGLAISPVDEKLYYQALTGQTLYRVPTDALDPNLKHETHLVKKVENLGTSPVSDGMIFDETGNLYMADLEKSSVTYRTPEGEVKVLIKDERLEWPDTFTIDEKKKMLIFSDSLLQSAAVGESVDGLTFRIYQVPLPKRSY